MGEVCPRRCCPLLRGLVCPLLFLIFVVSSVAYAFLIHTIYNTDLDIMERTRRQKIGFADQILSKIKVKKNKSAVSVPVKKDSRLLMRSLFLATQAMDYLANQRPDPRHFQYRKTVMGYTFSLSRCGGGCADHGEGATNLMNALKAWLRAHEEAQVMVASILVVIGMWWLVRTVLALLINLVCPLLVVLVAVMLVPQLRAPLLGQNYPALANVLHSILVKMAENIKVD